MAELKIFSDGAPDNCEQHIVIKADIAAVLKDVGVRYEQWQANGQLSVQPSEDEVKQAYASQISALIAEEGYQSMDVIALTPEHPDKAVLRAKFLDEHHHEEDEVRFFVGGQGLFSLHLQGKVYEVLCTKGDLISVPAKTLHWFDMGPQPHFVALRFFNNPDGWIAHYSGSDIAGGFSRLEN